MAESGASTASIDDKIGTTAWNNRLATLSAKGMLKEVRHGKTKLFSPVMETV